MSGYYLESLATKLVLKRSSSIRSFHLVWFGSCPMFPKFVSDMTGTPLLFVRIHWLLSRSVVHVGSWLFTLVRNTAHKVVACGTAPFGGLADSAMEFALHRHHRPLPRGIGVLGRSSDRRSDAEACVFRRTPLPLQSLACLDSET